MKHKPMLMNKVMSSHKGNGREVIGLIGTHHGAGVTYTGLMLAFYMGEELGKSTAFAECNSHQDMMLIKEAYEWSEGNGNSFSFRNVTCYKEVTTDRIPEIYGGPYECLILDFGTDFDKNKEEFLRCSTKIVVGGRSVWDLRKLDRFIKVSKAVRGSDAWLYFIPQAEDNAAIKISKEAGRKVWPVPLCEEPTLPSRNVILFFSKIFPS